MDQSWSYVNTFTLTWATNLIGCLASPSLSFTHPIIALTRRKPICTSHYCPGLTMACWFHSKSSPTSFLCHRLWQSSKHLKLSQSWFQCSSLNNPREQPCMNPKLELNTITCITPALGDNYWYTFCLGQCHDPIIPKFDNFNQIEYKSYSFVTTPNIYPWKLGSQTLKRHVRHLLFFKSIHIPLNLLMDIQLKSQTNGLM